MAGGSDKDMGLGWGVAASAMLKEPLSSLVFLFFSARAPLTLSHIHGLFLRGSLFFRVPLKLFMGHLALTSLSQTDRQSLYSRSCGGGDPARLLPLDHVVYPRQGVSHLVEHHGLQPADGGAVGDDAHDRPAAGGVLNLERRVFFLATTSKDFP